MKEVYLTGMGIQVPSPSNIGLNFETEFERPHLREKSSQARPFRPFSVLHPNNQQSHYNHKENQFGQK
ncbi:hypothetical protein C7R93_21565 [Brevibacillus fortis]|uniref:Uncharacterized protein n=1 Tax=Brevibacillus fortis TaxID=2126352 RepID=A0A2P7UWJ2_9BACL|nr:hypothetical protein C7R93_21565 [Brevibacillus fortis]